MVRTQIQLPEDVYHRLRAAANDADRSISDCIREAISLFLAKEPNKVDFTRLRKGFASLPDDNPGSLDSWLAEAIIESKQG